MTIARLLLGVVLALVALVPVEMGAATVRRRLLPWWTGLEARLVDVVLALSLTVGVCEALGAVGLFRTVPIVIGLAAAGGLAWYGARWLPEPGRPPRPGAGDATPDAAPVAGPIDPDERDAPVSTAPMVVTGLVVAALAGSWAARTARAWDRGMETIDTLWYHLPFAARYVQTGHLLSIHYVDGDPGTAFFPAGSSLLHGLGILVLGSDVASPVLNLGWLALALAAAWCLGRPFGVAPLTTIGASLLLAAPLLTATQPGGGYSDVMGLALFLTAAALLVQHRHDRRPGMQDLVVALAAGLALSTKFSLVGPVAALVVAQIATAPRGRRLLRTGVAAAGLVLAGSFWYLRNLFAVGNPLPSLEVHLGPVSLPSVKATVPYGSVARFVFDGPAWNDYFIPGLRLALGPAWPAVVAFALAGLVVGTVGRRPVLVRALAVVGVVSLVAYAFTPGYLLFFGRPVFFAYTFRYAGPAVLLGLVVLPLAWRRGRVWLLVGYTAAFAVTQLDPTSWPTGFSWAVFQDRAAAPDAWWGLLVAVLVAGAWLGPTLWPAGRRHGSGVRLATLTFAAVAVVLLLVHGTYLDRRYADSPPFPRLYAWARDLRSSRIAVSGMLMQEQYPLAGTDLSNRVQFAGVPADDGNFRPIASCAEWARFLDEGAFDYVVITPPSQGAAAREIAWTEELGGQAVPEAADDTTTVPVRVYRLDPRAPLPAC